MAKWIILAVVVVLVVYLISIYNRLVKMRTWTEESFSQIDVQLQRRNDLIPNLVETVKGYTKHESETLQGVIDARKQMINLPKDATPEQINAMSNQLSSALSRLMAVSEAYPDLKANTNFSQLQTSLSETEDKIARARQLYNSSVGQYNQNLETFPNNLIANSFGFKPKEYLTAPQEAQVAPKVSFD